MWKNVHFLGRTLFCLSCSSRFKLLSVKSVFYGGFEHIFHDKRWQWFCLRCTFWRYHLTIKQRGQYCDKFFLWCFFDEVSVSVATDLLCSFMVVITVCSNYPTVFSIYSNIIVFCTSFPTVHRSFCSWRKQPDMLSFYLHELITMTFYKLLKRE